MPLSLWQLILRGCAAGLCIFGSFGHASAAEPAAPKDPAASQAAELVHQALEAEFLADATRREEHLKAALAIDPTHEQANWLSGRVNLDGKWLNLAEAYEAQSDTNLLYGLKRSRLDGSPQKEHQLARWCATQGQDDRARLHYARVLMNPSSDPDMVREGLKKLDLQLFNGRFLTKEEIAAEEKAAADITQAFKTWQPKLTEWQRMIEGKSVPQAKVAREKLAAIDDPNIVPVLEAQIPRASELLSVEIVALLSKFPLQRSTEALCRASVFSPHQKVRTAAINELKNRKLHDYVPFFLAALNPYTRSRFQIQHGVDGSVSYVHQVYQEGPLANRLGTLSRAAVALNSRQSTRRRSRPGEPTTPSINFTSGENNADVGYVLSAAVAAASTEQKVAQANAVAQSVNLPVFHVLEQATGQPLNRDPVKWWSWWQKHNEVYSQRPTHYVVDQKLTSFVKSYQHTERVNMASCFAAGTLVTTDGGPRSIESIEIGDRVLSRNPETGELTFKLVLQKTLRPATDVAKVIAGEEPITVSLGHPFWVNREGWRMTKELAAGDYLHSLSGGQLVQGAEKLNWQMPVHNLVVDGFHTYFVGSQGLMVHDNTYREPTLVLVPGLVVAE